MQLSLLPANRPFSQGSIVNGGSSPCPSASLLMVSPRFPYVPFPVRCWPLAIAPVLSQVTTVQSIKPCLCMTFCVMIPSALEEFHERFRWIQNVPWLWGISTEPQSPECPTDRIDLQELPFICGCQCAPWTAGLHWEAPFLHSAKPVFFDRNDLRLGRRQHKLINSKTGDPQAACSLYS